MEFKGRNQEYLIIEEISSDNCFILKERIENGLSIVWNLEGKSILSIDGQKFPLEEGEMIFLTEFHHVKVDQIGKAKLVRFNRPFYCIKDHDSEVSCKGILFFGASQVPRVKLDGESKKQFELLWEVFEMEMKSVDHLQYEMLQMLLKRLIILCTRLFKEQQKVEGMETKKMDIVREFNYLVESHFRKYHAVADYAELLFKSPKTLSNLFAQYNQKTPLQIIHERILLEAKRMLSYTDTPVKEIAYELGYDDLQSFSRFFKARTKSSPKKYREFQSSGKIDNSLGKIA
ncbi:MAG: helix-turn-helix domain-containing protein [Bacteroidota bacterium]